LPLDVPGAFLVSAKQSDGKVAWVEVFSEAGGPLKIVSPWKPPVICEHLSGRQTFMGDILTVKTTAGERLLFKPAQQDE